MAKTFRKHKTKAKRKSRGTVRPPRTLEEFTAKPLRTREVIRLSIEAVNKMKYDISLTKAASEVGISRDSVIRWAGSALTKRSSGRYTAKKRDSLLRIMKIPTETGYQVLGIKGSKKASELEQYWAALNKFWATGDASGLDKFRGREIVDASGNKIPFITNLRQLKDLARSGEIRFDTIYGDTH